MDILDSHFYSGPCLWADQSGLCLTLSLNKAEAELFDTKLSETERDHVFKQLDLLTPDRSYLPAPFARESSDLFFVVATLQYDFMVAPLSGWFIERREDWIRLFLPCDDQNIGWFALNLALDWVSKPNRDFAQNSEPFQKFLEFCRERSFDAVTQSVARAAHARGVPYDRLADGSIQLGQGQNSRRCDAAMLADMATQNLRPEIFISQLYPDPSHSRIPIAGITGSVGKTTTTRMVASIFEKAGKTVAMATTQGAYIGTDRFRESDSAAGHFARRLLQDQRVQFGVFELARGGLVHNGLGLDKLDVGACLNIYDNHLGLSGIKTRDDLARIKRLVIEHAQEMVVLNADDPLCYAMRLHTNAKKLCLISTQPENSILRDHQKSGGAIVELSKKGNEIELCDGETPIVKIPISDIPETFNGQYRPAMICAQFAMAIAYGLGASGPQIRSGLGSFRSTYDTNPGRMNVFEGLPFQLLVTHADGPQVIREIGRLVDSFEIQGQKHILLCAAGSRTDEFVQLTAINAAKSFTRFILTDELDLRGRARGEIPELLAWTLRREGISEDHITIASGYHDALEIAFSSSKEGDFLLVIVSPDDFGKVWDRAAKEKV